jgi:hypothetical protein
MTGDPSIRSIQSETDKQPIPNTFYASRSVCFKSVKWIVADDRGQVLSSGTYLIYNL